MTNDKLLAVMDIENYNVIASSSWVFDRRENRVSRETFSKPFEKNTCDKAVPITAYNHYSIEYRLCIKETEDIEDRVILTASQFASIRAAVASLIAERDALLKANEWQDIASAPSGKPVLIHYKNSIGKSRVIKAKYIARFTEESSCETSEGVDEYDIYNDRYTYCEGWWEIIDNWDDFNFVEVNEGNPDGWKPLPSPPSQEKCDGT